MQYDISVVQKETKIGTEVLFSYILLAPESVLNFIRL